MESFLIVVLSLTVFFFIVFLISWINERKILTIILGVVTILFFAGTGYFAWRNDQIEKFQIVQVEKTDKHGETAYEFTLKSNKGEINQIWIKEKDIGTYDNNSMFVKVINEYQEDKD